MPRTFGRVVIVPWTSMLPSGRFDRWTSVDEVWLRVSDDVDPVQLGRAVALSLNVARPGGQDFEVVVPIELLAEQVRVRGTFGVLVAGVAVMTLLVGGIGVMNVMLTAVLERTSEIGLRRTVGATSRAIAIQFLMEATAIGLAGGVGGLLLGGGFVAILASFGGWPVRISVTAVFLGLALAGVVGVMSGLYPARRAARLQPIDAVRYE